MIVAICGAKRHGKGTAASSLVNHGFVEINFADALKESCAAAFGIPLEVFYDDTRKEAPLADYGYPNESPRSILQYVGTEMFRSKWDGIWVNTWLNKARKHKRVVCSDLRFPNEYDMLRANGAMIMRVVRPGWESGDTHASEAHAKTFVVDAELINNSSMVNLRYNAVMAVANHFSDF